MSHSFYRLCQYTLAARNVPYHIKSNSKNLLNHSTRCNSHLYFNSRDFRNSTLNCAMFNVQDEEDFEEKVLKSGTPVVVDFHANWCGPCKVLGPRLESIIGGKGEKVHLAKIDIDAVSDLALEYGVSAVPSVLGIKDGKVVDKFVGVQEETRINAFVDKLIGSE